MKRLLFIDDDENLLSSYRRLFFQYRSNWEVSFVSDPFNAREMISAHHYDIIICDRLMPGIKGEVLLHEASLRMPESLLVLLSGDESIEEIMTPFPWVSRFLHKPCHFSKIQDLLKEAE